MEENAGLPDAIDALLQHWSEGDVICIRHRLGDREEEVLRRAYDEGVRERLFSASKGEIKDICDDLVGRFPGFGSLALKIERTGQAVKVRAATGINSLLDALYWMIWQNYFIQMPWQACEECGRIFRPTSNHKRKFCPHRDCAHRKAARESAQRKAKGLKDAQVNQANGDNDGTGHTDFVVDGQRFRQYLETTDWREAQAKEKDLISAAKAGKLAATKNVVAKLSFSDAATLFLEDRLSHLAPRSIQTERERAKAINKTLGNVQVSRIAIADVVSYIRQRKTAGIANATVNRELDIIRGVLKKAKRWHQFADDIHPLPVRQNIGRALSYEEKVHLLRVAAARPEWQNAAWAASLALNTTLRGCEIKQLCWRHIDLIERTLTVRKSKTEGGKNDPSEGGCVGGRFAALQARSGVRGNSGWPLRLSCM